jgi:hypothetical protein
MKLRPSLLSLILAGLLHAAAEEVADFAPKEFSLSSYAHGGGSGGTTTVTFRDGVLTRKSEYSGFAAPKNRTETATTTLTLIADPTTKRFFRVRALQSLAP